VVNRDFVLGVAEKEEFVRLMRLYEAFCELRVVTFCVMDNHFHILLAVPGRPEVMPSHKELYEHLCATLGQAEGDRFYEQMEMAARAMSEEWEEKIRERYLCRMWDVSQFMKTLKQRFTQWFNGRHKRKGTLWEDRYRSVLVESAGEPVRAMAAYIDLNPVRAGMVEDPAKYRWSGYGAAMGGDAAAFEGLAEFERVADVGVAPELVAERVAAREARSGSRRWREIMELHRVLLYGRGQERGVGKDGRPLKKGFKREEARKVVEAGGRLPLGVYLRCRIRYFTEGMAIGSREFTNEVFKEASWHFGARRKTGARPMRGQLKEERLYALRNLSRGAAS
jgi:REP element-mobilizing transposase RayT